MKKITLILGLLTVFSLTGCNQTTQENEVTQLPPSKSEGGSEEVNNINPSEQNIPNDIQASSTLTNKSNNGEKKYKLMAPDEYAPIFLTLKPDLSFDMDFNYCQGISHGSGHYSVENDLYFLTVKNSTDMPSLNTVKLELKQISDTELQVVSEVYRNENNEKAYFCTPFNDPNHELEGAEYNVYQLIN